MPQNSAAISAVVMDIGASFLVGWVVELGP